MITKKIVLLGAFAVGKTSLVQRFVTGIFSDRYMTTVGVRIDRRELVVDGKAMQLLVWDLQGEDENHRVRLSHLRGASGVLLVADGTRADTFATALRLRSEVAAIVAAPALLLVNKIDLRSQWEVPETQLAEQRAAGHTVFETSARTGNDVETAFVELGRRMLPA